MSPMTRSLYAPLNLLLSLAMLAGCAGQSGGTPQLAPSYALSDSVCAAQRQALVKAGDIFLQEAIIGGNATAGSGGSAIATSYLSSLKGLFGGNTTGIGRQAYSSSLTRC